MKERHARNKINDQDATNKTIFIINPSDNRREKQTVKYNSDMDSDEKIKLFLPTQSTKWSCPHDQKNDSYKSEFADILQTFAVQTTIPGLFQVATRRRRLWQIFWVIVSLAGLAMSMYQSKDVMMDYIRGRTIQVVDYRSVSDVRYPSITVCSNIILDDEKITPELARKFCDGPNVSACVRTSLSRKSYGQLEFEEDMLMDNVMKYQSRFTSVERQRLFYVFTDAFLTSCSWELENCNFSNIDHVYLFNTLQSGLCVTVNIGTNTFMTAAQNGAINLVFEMDRDSRRLKMNEIYASLWIHPPGTSASMYADNGATVYPGDKIRINYQMQYITRIPSRKCVKKESLYSIRQNPYYKAETPYTYSTRDCQFTRQDKRLRIPRKCFHPAVNYENLSTILDNGGVFCTSLSKGYNILF